MQMLIEKNPPTEHEFTKIVKKRHQKTLFKNEL